MKDQDSLGKSIKDCNALQLRVKKFGAILHNSFKFNSTLWLMCPKEPSSHFISDMIISWQRAVHFLSRVQTPSMYKVSMSSLLTKLAEDEM